MARVNCGFCGNSTTNPKYCSRSCSATASNKKSPKRKPEGMCSGCTQPTQKRRKWCESCWAAHGGVLDMTLGEAIYQNTHRASAYGLVRSRARARGKAKLVRACESCGWTAHTEVCHVQPISSFPLSTRISEINADSNIRILCPNCHWLHDHPNITA